MDSLADCFTPFDLRERLGELSVDLKMTYDEALQRMKRSRRQNEKRYLDRLLSWMSWVERPLNIAEFRHALSSRPGLGTIPEDSMLSDETIHKITTWTAGLVFIDNRSFVRFIHPTTARYFVQHRESLFPQGDTEIAHVCLSYLDIDAVRAPLPEADDKSHFTLRVRCFSLVEYAVLWSWKHVARSVQKDDDHLAAAFLRSDQARHFLTRALYILDPSWNVNGYAAPLHLAVHFALTDVVDLLLSTGDDTNVRDSFGSTPLIYAAESKEDTLACVQRLLLAGADASLTCQGGSTALIRGVYHRNQVIVDCLLKEPDVAVNAITTSWRETNYSVLMLSILVNNEATFRKLLGRPDVDVNLQSRDGKAALHLACYRSFTWAVEGLLKRQDVDLELCADCHLNTALIYAGYCGPLANVQRLLDRGANLKHLDSSHGSVLNRAIDVGKADIARFLIQKGADLNHKDFMGRIVIHSAAINSAWQCLGILLEDPSLVDINCQGVNGETPLHDACEQRDVDGVRMLVAAGARCDIKDSAGRTAIDIAKANERVEMLEILETAPGYRTAFTIGTAKALFDAVVIDTAEALGERIQNASIEELNTASAFKGPPVSQACENRRAHVVRMLLNAGADPEVTSGFDRTPLYFAIRGGNVDCVDALMSFGANIDRPCFPGPEVPWEFALSMYRVDGERAAMLLLERGATIPQTSAYIQRALQIAAETDNLGVAKRMVDSGASIHLKLQGISAFQIAEEYDSVAVLNHFLDSSAAERS